MVAIDHSQPLARSRSPTWVDTYIGRRIQQGRIEVHMSQDKLNSVPASRLADIAAVLKAAAGDFFPPIDDKAPHLRRAI